MFLTYGISAEVTRAPNAPDGNKMPLVATYICTNMYETLEEALGEAVMAVSKQFAVVPGDVRIWVEKKTHDGYDFYLGHTGYAPLGVKNIPLMYVEGLNGPIQEVVKRTFAVNSNSLVSSASD